MAMKHLHAVHRPGKQGTHRIMHLVETKTALLTLYTAALCGDKPPLSTSGWVKTTEDATCEPCLRRKRMIERKLAK